MTTTSIRISINAQISHFFSYLLFRVQYIGKATNDNNYVENSFCLKINIGLIRLPTSFSVKLSLIEYVSGFWLIQFIKFEILNGVTKWSVASDRSIKLDLLLIDCIGVWFSPRRKPVDNQDNHYSPWPLHSVSIMGALDQSTVSRDLDISFKSPQKPGTRQTDPDISCVKDNF